MVTEWDAHAPGQLHREIPGSLVFVDISGFTALSEKLAARGRIGAEELTSVLDRVFGDMLVAAYERRGSLLKFGGDALLMLFEGDDHAVQAVSAAMEMRASLRRAADEKTSVGRIALRMTVGVWSGVVDAYLVGGSHRELLLAGGGIDGVVAVEGSAEPNEIIVADSTAAHLPKRILGESNGTGTRLRGRTIPVVAPGPIIRESARDEDLEQFVPTALRRRLSSGLRDPEHKVATVAFVKFSGVPELLAAEGHQAVAEALHVLLSSAQSTLDVEGATFLASDADTGGGKLIAVSGVPDVLEDAEGRLLRAIRTIVDTDVPLKVRAGLQRGHVFVAEPGTPFRATFTVMGDTVNTAARLMAAANPGGVFAAPEVLERSATLFRTEPLPPIAAKGKSEGLAAAAVFEETGRREVDATHDLPFVGRDGEMVGLREVLGAGGRLTLVGDTGIGKTRLLTEALEAYEGTHLVITAEPAGKENAYWAFRDPLRASLDIPRTSQEEMATLLSARVAGIAPTLMDHLPLIGDVLQIQVPETPTTEALSDQHRPAETARVMGDFLEAHLGRDHTLVIEDLHWLDEVGVGLVRALADRRGTPRTMLVSMREVEGLDPVGDALRVGPLDYDAMELAARTATQAVPPRPEVLEALIERADGNPLFLTELLSILGSVGSIDEVPDSLAGVAGVQIDALPPLSRQVLRVASVLGRSFRKVVLDALLESEGLTIDDATRHDLTEFIDVEGHRWRFHHAVIHDAAYQGLSYAKRRALHAEAGAVVEHLAGDHPEAVAEFLARHYAEAGVDDKAWHYGMLAGEHARKTYTNTAAEQYLRLAITAGGRCGTEAERIGLAWDQLGDVLERQARFGEARDAYTHALKSLKESSRSLRAPIHARRARTWSLEGSVPNARRLITLGLKDVGGKPEAEAELGSVEAAIAMSAEDPVSAVAIAGRALPVAESAGVEPEVLARLHTVLDWGHGMLGQESEVDHGALALELAAQTGDFERAADVMNNKGGLAYFAGDWKAAVNWYEQAVDASLKAGNQMGAANARANMLELFIGQRRFDEADSLLPEVRRAFTALGMGSLMWFVDLQEGRLLSAIGFHRQAIELLEPLVEEWMAEDPFTALQLVLPLSESLAANGDFDKGIALLDAAEEASGDMAVYLRATVARARAITDGRAEVLNRAIKVAVEDAALLDELELLEQLANLGAVTPAQERRRHELNGQLGVAT